MKVTIYTLVAASAFAMNCISASPQRRPTVELAAHRHDTPVEKPGAAKARPTPLPLDGIFFASGYMGDVKAVRFSQEDKDCFRPNVPYQRWEYRPAAGTLGWAAVAFQSPANNWGDKPGRDFSHEHYHRVIFAAKGLHGGEKIIVTTGGGTKENATHPASYPERSLGAIALSTSWHEFSIEIDDVDTQNVTCALTWATNQDLNPDGAVFFISSARFE